MRAACYVRVSRADQRTDLQHNETAALIAARGWAATSTFLDEGISGATDKRPGFRAMLEDARRRRFDVLVVYRSDRLFRSLADFVTTLDELAARGIGFVSVTEPFDTTTPSGRLLIQIVGAFAEFERNVLASRTRDGLAAARKRGVRLGRPRAAFDVARAKALSTSGATLREIARELGVGVGTVHAALAPANDFGRDHAQVLRGQVLHEAPVLGNTLALRP